ncbi:MAG: energy transducer TonB [Bacteroidia bacterium]
MHQQVKGPDRVILFEIGIIVALLFTNWFINLEYQTDFAFENPPEQNWADSPFVLGPIEDPIPIDEQEQESSIIPFDVSSLVKVVDDLFKIKEKKLVPPRKIKTPIGFLPIKTGRGQSHKIDSFVEQMPQFPGGEKALASFVQTNYEFTSYMFEHAETVQVVVRFIVDENGKVTDPQVVSCSFSGLGAEQEAINLLMKMPNWIPGEQMGRKVKVRMQLPLRLQVY